MAGELVQVDCILDAQAAVGESPLWCDRTNRLYWVDISGCKIHRTDPLTGHDEAWPTEGEVGCLALREEGGLLAAGRQGYWFFHPDGQVTHRLHDPEEDKPQNRFNDGCCDTAGRFWAGTMQMGEPAPKGSLYVLDKDRRSRFFLDGFFTPNGLAFSLDGRLMYASDSNPAVQTIWIWDYDAADGVATNRRVFMTTHDLAGRPDGGAVDADGCYWMAGVGGWQLVRFTPDGRVDREIGMPCEKPTKIAFGGPNLDTMYVTSIGKGLSPGTEHRQPNAGGVFAVDAGVPGPRANRFGG